MIENVRVSDVVIVQKRRRRSGSDRATGEALKSCTMIVTAPNDLAEIHDRMPVVLERSDFDAWLKDRGTECERRVAALAGLEARQQFASWARLAPWP
jgi:putative SOS response-associated peptidase YedK